MEEKRNNLLPSAWFICIVHVHDTPPPLFFCLPYSSIPFLVTIAKFPYLLLNLFNSRLSEILMSVSNSTCVTSRDISVIHVAD